MSGAPIVIPALFAANGVSAASGAKLYSYIKGTTTPRALFTDEALTTPAANPVIANSLGRTVVYRDPGLSYDLLAKTSDDATTLIPTFTYNASLSDVSPGTGWSTHLSEALPWFFAADYGVVADGSTNDAVAFQAAWDACAAAGGGILWVPEGTIKLTTQVTLDGNYVTVRGMGLSASTIYSTYTAGPAILLGNTSTQTKDYAFEDVYLSGAVGQQFFKSRYVRGLYLRRCKWNVDRLITLGDSSAGTGKSHYIFHMEDCPSTSQIDSATLHFIYAENFSGQWVMKNVFVEGKFVAGVDGFYATDNIQNRIDHVIVTGGYFGRFRDNYSFVDARVVNFHISADHESEGPLRNAVRLEVTTATTKTVGQVGWGTCIIAGKFAGEFSNSIYMKCERTGTASRNWVVGPCMFTNTLYTPVKVESLVGAISAGVIHDISFEMAPADANQDVVSIVGGTSAVTVSQIAISNIAGDAFITALRSVVNVEGFTSLITRPTNIGGATLKSATLRDTRLAVLDEYEYMQEPEGRLTLTTATPVLGSAVTAATTVYYTPYRGNRIPLLTESLFCERTFTELSLTLDSNSGNTGYQQSGKNFDLFIYNDAGTLRLCTGPAWTNDTTRSAALTKLRGFEVNNASITLKYDATSATLTAAANSALYVGTMRASADGQTEMSIGAPTAAAGGTANKLFLWNRYNQTPTIATCRDSTDSWTYTTAAWQAKNGSTSNRIGFVIGLSEGSLNVEANAFSSNSSANVRRFSGIGYDSASALAAGCRSGVAENAVANMANMLASYDAPLALGYHYVQELEYSSATGTTTWYGDAGSASVYQTGMTVELMM